MGFTFAEQYNRARWISTKTRQFITRDVLWPDELAYGYATGRPTTLVDPTGKGVGPCAVYACQPKEGFGPIKHQFICVDGPHGGCSAGTSSRLKNESCKVDQAYAGPGMPPCLEHLKGLADCTLVTTSCPGAREACKEIKAWPDSEWCYWLGGTCYGFVDYIKKKAACVACEALRNNYSEYKKCICNSCFCTHGLTSGRRCKNKNGASFPCGRS